MTHASYRNANRPRYATPTCILLCLLASCAAQKRAADEIVVLVEQPASNPDPRFAVSAYDFKLSYLAYAPLVSVDNQKTEPQMELAASVESLPPLAGDFAWRVKLRDAKFSDGSAVTADDVAYTIERMIDPKGASRLRARFVDAGLQRVEVVNPRELIFHLNQPHAPFVTDLDIGVIKRGGGGGEWPIGAGAFVIESHEGDNWHLRRNPYFYDGPAKSARLVIKTIRDDNSRLLALVGGSADLTQNTISPLLVDAVTAEKRLKVITAPSAVYSYIGFNCDDPIFKDPRVRQAIAYAIDRRQLVARKLHGRAVLATGLLPTFHWAYAAEPQYEYDPAKARALLDAAGYPDPDGAGPGSRFHIVYKTSSNRFRVAMAQVIVSMLAEVGIDVELRVFEFSTFFADIKKGNFQMFSMQIPEISEPNLYTNFFHSRYIPRRDNLDAGGNRVRYRNPELDALLDAGVRELDRDKRRAIYADVQRVLQRDVPVISLWHEDNIAAMQSDISGFTLLPTAQMTPLRDVMRR
jgi:peptide/nickel transport system substrate-binding protein